MLFGMSGRCALLVLILSALQFHVVISDNQKLDEIRESNGKRGKTINYMFDHNVTEIAKNLPKEVFDYLSNVTCLKFVEIVGNARKNTIVISMNESWNFAYAGHCNYETVATSILDTLGSHNVDNVEQKEFHMVAVPDEYMPIWVNPDIPHKEPEYLKNIDQRIEPTFLDVLKVNKRYCSGQVNWTSRMCQNEGYLNPANNKTCLCLEAFSGDHCELLNTDENCGGNIELGQFVGQRTLKANLNGQGKCTWNVTAPEGEKISVSTRGSDLRSYSVDCPKNWIDVIFDSPSKNGQKFYNISSDNLTTVVQNNQVYILYRSNGALPTSAKIHVKINDNLTVIIIVGLIFLLFVIVYIAYRCYICYIKKKWSHDSHSEPTLSHEI